MSVKSGQDQALKSVGFMIFLMKRWSCSTTLLKHWTWNISTKLSKPASISIFQPSIIGADFIPNYFCWQTIRVDRLFEEGCSRHEVATVCLRFLAAMAKEDEWRTTQRLMVAGSTLTPLSSRIHSRSR